MTPAPRTFSAPSSSGQRARAGASSGSVSPTASRSAPGPGDHRRIVGAQPGGRNAEARALRAPRGRRARGGSPGWRRLRRRRPAPARRFAERERGAVDEAVDDRLLEARGDVFAADIRPMRPRAAPRSSGRRRRNGARPSRPAGAAAARPPDRPTAPTPRSPGRRDRAGRAAWRPCRTPRPPHRRWSSPAAGSRRRRAPRAIGNARPTPAAADKGNRGRDRPAAGESAWPSRWLTAISGLPAASASPLPASSATITPPIRPGPAVAATASTSADRQSWPRRAPAGSGQAGSRRGRAPRSPAPRRHRAGAPGLADHRLRKDPPVAGDQRRGAVVAGGFKAED